eukprot:scaffold72399_cov22-Prasinocladus_malaysianus.AAC.2
MYWLQFRGDVVPAQHSTNSAPCAAPIKSFSESFFPIAAVRVATWRVANLTSSTRGAQAG